MCDDIVGVGAARPAEDRPVYFVSGTVLVALRLVDEGRDLGRRLREIALIAGRVAGEVVVHLFPFLAGILRIRR